MRADTMLPLKSDTGDESQMSIYTKRGDKGITDMARTRNISKSDDRIRLSGAIDELNSHIGLMISMISSQETVQFLESVQSTLIWLQREWRIHITENAGSVKRG